MVELMSAHRAQVKLKALEVHDQGVRQLLDGAPPLRRYSLPTLLAEVAVIALRHETEHAEDTARQ